MRCSAIQSSLLSPYPLERELGLRVAIEYLVPGRLLEVHFIEAHERFLQIDVRKIGAEQRFVLEPAADRFEENLRQLFGQIARGVDEKVLLMRDDADGFLFP